MAGFSPGLDLLSRKVHGAGGNRTMNIIIQDVFIGGYVPGDSVLHRLDPRTKLIGLIVLLIGVFATRTDVGLLITSCAGADSHFPVRGWMAGLVVGLASLFVDAVDRRGDQYALQLGRPTHADWPMGASRHRTGYSRRSDPLRFSFCWQ